MEVLERYISESGRRSAFRSVCVAYPNKKSTSWYLCLADFDVPSNIQPGEYSMGGGTEKHRYESSRVVNANWNDVSWNVNEWQRDDNTWNDGNRVFSPENGGFLPMVIRWEFSFGCLFSILRSAGRSLVYLRKAHYIFCHPARGVPMRHVIGILKHLHP